MKGRLLIDLSEPERPKSGRRARGFPAAVWSGAREGEPAPEIEIVLHDADVALTWPGEWKAERRRQSHKAHVSREIENRKRRVDVRIRQVPSPVITQLTCRVAASYCTIADDATFARRVMRLILDTRRQYGHAPLTVAQDNALFTLLRKHASRGTCEKTAWRQVLVEWVRK